MSLLGRIRLAGELVKFSHTVFALPFALAGALLAGNPWPAWAQVFWILAAMVGARTGAMAVNRLADASLDADNPRTAARPLPSGRMGRPAAALLALFSFALLVLAAGMLNPLCLALSPLAILWVSLYSFTKRFTWFSHLWLGVSLAIAPVGAWLGVRGHFSLPPLLLAGAVVLWVTGFDILYALQDLDFDRGKDLSSIPVRFGPRGAILLARLLHGATLALLGTLAAVEPSLGWPFLAGLAAGGLLLLWESVLVREGNLKRLDTAFFTANSFFSVILFLAVLADKLI